jgi:predicted MFS family arabinose efflux permease
LVGSAVGIGAALSTTIAGLLYDWIGSSAAFYGLSGLAAVGLTLAYLTFSETRPDVD